jgi:putative ABC transport system permease protein
MLKNYPVVALRSLLRNKTFSLINMLGLSIGISSALVIFWIADYELSFDKFEPGRDRIYKVVQDANFSGNPVHAPAVPAPLAKAVHDELTGIELTIPLFKYQRDGTAKVTVPNTTRLFTKQPGIMYINPDYFRLVPHQWLAGSPRTSLNEPFKVVLTESRARLYFPDEIPLNTVGKQLTYDKDLTLTVSGIVKDQAEHTDLGAAEFISHATIAKTGRLQDNFMMTEWNDWMAYSNLYIKLSPGSTKAGVEAQLASLYKKYTKPDPNDPAGWQPKLLPLSEMHFNTDYHTFGQRIASKSTLYGLLAIAGFLLALATINFINLSTAQATRRAKEIGIRKAMGGSRWQLIRQFMSETFLLVALATILSVALAPLLLGAFTSFIPPDLHADWTGHPGSLLFLAGLTLALTVLAGLYPAFLLSGYNPVRVLKDHWFTPDSHSSGVRLRKTLTVGQFVIAQFFVIATLVVGKQIYFGLNQDLGFRRDAIVTFNTDWDTLPSRQQRLLNTLQAMPEVEKVSKGFLSPGGGASIGNIKFKPRPDVHADVYYRWGDSNYLPLYQIKLVAGRNVYNSATVREALVNSTYARMLGYNKPEGIVGQSLTVNGQDVPIVGVMADFHEESMHQAIPPVTFISQAGGVFHVRLKTVNAAIVDKVQKAFKEVYPNADWEYEFVSDIVAKWYKTEQDTMYLLYWATGLTILISCLGLLGLVIYTTNTRTKEIGIRKVLGAGVGSIIAALSGEFIRLVILASVITLPFAWWAANRWLQGFAYRTPLNAWLFIGGITGLLFVALTTLSIQTIRAAIANPIKSLRTE